MTKVSLVYISLSGNTESFVRRLTDYLLEQHPSLEVEKIHIKDLVKEGQPFFEMDNLFIAFLPTYLGNIFIGQGVWHPHPWDDGKRCFSTRVAAGLRGSLREDRFRRVRNHQFCY